MFSLELQQSYITRYTTSWRLASLVGGEDPMVRQEQEVFEKKKARTGANSSGALAIETSGLDSNPMEGLLSSVLGILNGTFGSLAGNYLTLSSKGAK